MVKVFALVSFAAIGYQALAALWQVFPCWGGGYVQDVVLCSSDRQRLILSVDRGERDMAYCLTKR